MGFRMQVDEIAYEGENTVLTGRLEAGAISGPDTLQLPRRSGTLFIAEMIAIQGSGPPSATFGQEGSVVQIVLEGSPAPRDLDAPCIAETVPTPSAQAPSGLARLFWRWLGRR